MALTKSFQNYANIPSAIISDGILTVPLWAVTSVSLGQAYHLPAIGDTGAKAVVATHDDAITLAGVLVGPERYAWKLGLETLAEASKRGSALAAFTSGAFGGLILVTSLTIRTDMQVKTLTFNLSAAKRDAIDVSITMEHMPRPGALGKLMDVAAIGIGVLADAGGN